MAAAGWSFGLALAGITSMTLRQELTPDALLGRVTAAFWTIHGSAAPLGATLLTAAAGVGAGPPLLLVATVFAAVAAGALLTPIRRCEPVRSASAPAPRTARRWRRRAGRVWRSRRPPMRP